MVDTPNLESSLKSSITTPLTQQTPTNPYPSKQNLYTFLKIILVILFILSVGIGSYILGQKNQPIPKLIPDSSPAIQNSQSGNIIPSPQPIEKWLNVQYEFSQGYAFNVDYPPNAQIWIFDGKNSGLPISPMNQLFSKAISFSPPTDIDSKDSYQIVIGLSDVDPSECYQSKCEGVLEKITKNETTSISEVLAKRIESTAPNSGGVLLSPLPQVKLYVIPHLNKFLILYSEIGDDATFSKMVDSFKLVKY